MKNDILDLHDLLSVAHLLLGRVTAWNTVLVGLFRSGSFNTSPVDCIPLDLNGDA